MLYNIFLDDERFPALAKIPVTNQSSSAHTNTTTTTTPLDLHFNITIIIRNFEDFKYYVDTYGIPQFISFDHDLGSEWRTGLDCARYIIDYMLNNNIKQFPDYYVHSQNPCGRDNIISLIDSFKKQFKEDTDEI